jgi:hypothetical protein
MKCAKREPTTATRQLAIALDLPTLRGMTLAERQAAVVQLAGLLMEAAGVATTENADDGA